MTTNNPLLNWTEYPPFDQIRPEHVQPAVQTLLAESEQLLQTLEAQKMSHWADFMPALEQLEDKLHRVWGVISHLTMVKNSPELRTAHQTMQPAVVQFLNRYGQSRPLYEAYCALRDSQEWASYDPAQKRIITNAIREAELAGVGLTGEKREEFNQVSQHLAELGTQFSNHVLDANKAFMMVLTQAEEIMGLPQNALALAAQMAQRHGYPEATVHSGPWVFTLDLPSYNPFLKHSQRRDLREKLYRAYVTRASAGEYNNEPVIQELLQLRQQQAHLLGFNSYAELSLSRKMAGQVDAVHTLLHELLQASSASAQADLAELTQLAQAAGAPEAADFQQWDIAYWAERLLEQKYELKDEELRPYFALPRVLQGMFGLTEKLLSIRVEEDNSGTVPVWHEDVQFFRVYDLQTNELMAGFYLDPYSRPAEKRGGAWMDSLYGRSKLLAPAGKKVRVPIAYMCCNQSPPVGDQPSLMTFYEVETLFHEFGHALHHMLTTVEYNQAAGVANVEWDAIELPSQFIQNWVYHRPTLLKMAQHFETGATLPDELINRLMASRTFRAGYLMLRQLNFGLVDLALHHTYDPYGTQTPIEVQHQIANSIFAVPLIPEDRYLCGFTHLFSGGYAAGYFSYKWAEVLSADAYSAFEEAGLENEEALQTLGRRFRDTVLAWGGGKHPMELYVAFRGREPSTAALLRQNGLI